MCYVFMNEYGWVGKIKYKGPPFVTLESYLGVDGSMQQYQHIQQSTAWMLLKVKR